MPRNVPARLAAHLALPTTTTCNVLKITPAESSPATTFGTTTLNRDVPYDDGSGVITYRAKRGYTSMDVDTSADLSVDNTVAEGLLAEYPLDGVTAEGIARGDYDGARFVQYLINYMDPTPNNHVIINAGYIGQITISNDLSVSIELRSLMQILKQNSMIELTSITDRARYGDERNKMPLRWYDSSVASVGAEDDRTFTTDGIPGFDGASGGAGTVTDVPFFTGDGTAMQAQLLDTAGAPVYSGFTVTAIQKNGITLTAGTDYTVSSSGLVSWAVLPASGDAFTWSGTLALYPNGYFVPGVVHWLTGANAGRENEIEEYDATTGTITLLIPTLSPIAAGDTFKIRRDSDGSKARAIADNNLPNMRAEPELPRANGIDLQAPTPSS